MCTGLTGSFFFWFLQCSVCRQSNSVKFVPCLSANLYVKTFIMMLTNNDYIHLGYVYKTLRTPSTCACTKVVEALLICVFHPHFFFFFFYTPRKEREEVLAVPLIQTRRSRQSAGTFWCGDALVRTRTERGWLQQLLWCHKEAVSVAFKDEHVCVLF